MRIVKFAVLATIRSGRAVLRRQMVTVTSMARGAAIIVDGTQVGVTPARVSLSTQEGHVITVRGRAGEHTCRLPPVAPAGCVILGVVSPHAWLIELVNGHAGPLELTEYMLPAA